jgi:hypothetical protein
MNASVRASLRRMISLLRTSRPIAHRHTLTTRPMQSPRRPGERKTTADEARTGALRYRRLSVLGQGLVGAAGPRRSWEPSMVSCWVEDELKRIPARCLTSYTMVAVECSRNGLKGIERPDTLVDEGRQVGSSRWRVACVRVAYEHQRGQPWLPRLPRPAAAHVRAGRSRGRTPTQGGW